MEDLIKAWGQTARTASATIRVNSVEDAIQGLLEAAPLVSLSSDQQDRSRKAAIYTGRSQP